MLTLFVQEELAPGDSALTGSAINQRKMRYDNAGNLVNDSWTSYGSSTPGAFTRTYDAENRMTSALDSASGTTHYYYDGDGRRVRRVITNQPEVWQVYGLSGELVAEYSANAPATSPQKEYGYRNGQLLITANAPETVWVEDALPAGAIPAGDSEGWNWVSANPTSFSGSVASQSNVVAGEHQHYFFNATQTMTVNTGDHLVAYVYIDPANVPSECQRSSESGEI